MFFRRIADIWVVLYWAISLSVLMLLWRTGQMVPWVSPDTESWLAVDWSWGSLGLSRFPLYGWILHGVGWGAGSAALPWVQDCGFILAAFALARAVRQRGASSEAALAVGLAPVLSCVMLLWGRAILPDVGSEAALLAALAATVAAGSRRRVGRNLILASLFGTVAYLLKPALLPFVAGLPLVLLLDGARLPRRGRVAGALLLGLAAPFLLIASLRLAVVRDFNIVSFGGFQMSGMAALMLTPDTVERLPETMRPEAHAILTRRGGLEAEGRALAVPVNAAGVRSFPSAAAGYFDLLARTYDTVLYEAVRPTQGDGESWVAFNARLQRFAVATVIAEKVSYAAWVAGAMARLLGRLAVFNPGVILGVGLVAVGLLRPGVVRAAAPGEMRILLVLVGVHTAAASLLIVLVTFPAARYIDGAGMLLAALPLYAGMRMLTAPRSEIGGAHLPRETLGLTLPDDTGVLQHVDPVRVG